MLFKTYDPLGLLSPELQTKWDTFAQDLKKGISTTLPPHYVTASQTAVSASNPQMFAYASPKAHGAGAYITDGRQFSLVTCHSLEETNTTTTGPHGSTDLCQASQFYPSCPQANVSSFTSQAVVWERKSPALASQ